MDAHIKYDPVKRMAILESEFLDNVREHFSVKVPKYGAAKLNPFIPDRRYVITPSGAFEVGMFAEIITFLRKQDIPFNITIDQEFKDLLNIGYDIKTFHQLKYPLRDYQRDIVDICLKKGYGNIVLATAGGKTLTMATLIENIVKNSDKPIKTLIVVPDIGLVEQTYADFIDYNIDPSRITKWSGKNTPNLDAPIIVANLGILQSESSDISWVAGVDLLIVDEVHKLRRDNKVNKIIRMVHTMHKFGFTGTMPEDPTDRWNVIGKIGPIWYERMAYQLREDKYVAESSIVVLEIHYKTMPNYDYSNAASTANYDAEMEFIISNEYRNTVITRLAQNFKNNALIMVDRIEHGQTLFNILSQHLVGKQVYFIHGDVEVAERKRIQSLMEESTNVVCVAISKIFSTGINIKNLHYIVFAAGGKAKVKIVQSIGRGLRLHESKSIFTIIDICDFLQYGIKHLTNRKKLYDTERIRYTTKQLRE